MVLAADLRRDYLFVALDLYVTVYQAVCFRGNGIPKVRRGDYIVYDRGRLPYLNMIERRDVFIVPTRTDCSAMSRRSPRAPSSISVRSNITWHRSIRIPATRTFFPMGTGAFETGFNKVRNDFVDIKPRAGEWSEEILISISCAVVDVQDRDFIVFHPVRHYIRKWSDQLPRTRLASGPSLTRHSPKRLNGVGECEAW